MTKCQGSPCWKLSNIKTHRYKDGWSPCLVALEAHCHAMSRIAYHMRGFGKGRWWKGPVDQVAGVKLAVDEWEATVHALKWLDGKIPLEAWVGLSPTEWRLQSNDSPGDLLRVCYADLKLLTKACHGRKRREKQISIS